MRCAASTSTAAPRASSACVASNAGNASKPRSRRVNASRSASSDPVSRAGFSIAVGGTNKKAPSETGPFRACEEPLLRLRLDRDGRLALRTVLRVLDRARRRGEERVVLADADVLARMEDRATLPHEDRARVHQLAAVGLETQALALGIAAVAGRAACFLVCHEGSFSRSRPHGFPCSSGDGLASWCSACGGAA